MKRYFFYPLVILSLCWFSFAQVSDQLKDADSHHRIVPLMQNGKITARGIPKYEVISGNPEKAGEPFVIRLHNYDNQVVPPHWHPEDEHIVLLKGTWYVGEGDVWNPSAMREINVGDYVFVPKEKRHFGLSKGETVMQVHGIGPFKVNLADPWMFLSDSKAAAFFKFKENELVESKRGRGVIRFGAYSEKNKIIQYGVETANGDGFYEFENELKRIPSKK